MKIAVDIDDVLSNTTDSVLAYYNMNFSPKISKEDLVSFPYLGFLGTTKEEANKKFFSFVEDGNLGKIEPLQGAVEAIEKLSCKFELAAVTSRAKFMKEETTAWLEKYFAGKFTEVLFTNDRLDKTDCSPYYGRSKSAICDEIGAEILIDDLIRFTDGTEHLKVFLINKPWNQSEILPHVDRVDTWGEILGKIGI